MMCVFFFFLVLKLRESKQTLDGFNETPENDSKNKALSMNGININDEQPVRRSINLTTMFNSGKVIYFWLMKYISNVYKNIDYSIIFHKIYLHLAGTGIIHE